MDKLEFVQYSVAFAITGTWKGTSRDKFYLELGWESLKSRRWSKPLTLFYKILNNLTSLYSKEPIPSPHQLTYILRDRDVIRRTGARNEAFQFSFYPNCISEWNKLDAEIKLAPYVGIFKKKLSSIIHPPAKSVFGDYEPRGLSHLSQKRVGLSKLNFHKFRPSFRDTINPLCPKNVDIEDAVRFLLLCSSFDMQIRDLLARVTDLLRPFVDITNLPRDLFICLLLYGDQNLPNDLSKNIIELTSRLIHETCRLK